MKRSLTGFYIFTFSLLCQVVGAKETGMSEPLPPVYVEIFERLDNRKRETLKDLYGSVMAVAVFGIDCSWCKKQHRVLKNLQDECSDLNTIMMGIGHDKRKLNVDLRRYQNKFPAFQINNNLLNALENVNVPRLLLFDPQGRARLNLSGFIPKGELLLLLNKQLNYQC
jgi:thioredoxin-related protein